MKQGDVTTQDEAVVLPSAKAVQFTRDLTLASGTQAITGIGFRPSALMGYNIIDPSNNMGMGFTDSTGAAKNFGINTRDDFAVDTWEASNFIHVLQGGGITYGSELQSFDADGFTIDWTKTGATTGTLLCRFLVFK